MEQDVRDEDIKNSSKSNTNRILPSVYSPAEIARHRTRMENLESGSNDSSEDESIISEYNDVDINIRIFEELKSTDNVIGEMLCNINKNCKPPLSGLGLDEQLKHSSPGYFKVSFNAIFDDAKNLNKNGGTLENESFQIENDTLSVNSDISTPLNESIDTVKENNNRVEENIDTITENDKSEEENKFTTTNSEMAEYQNNNAENTSDIEVIECDESDIEIIISKSISRKKSISALTKLKLEYDPKLNNETEKKTMFDLIYFNPNKESEPRTNQDNTNKEESVLDENSDNDKENSDIEDTENPDPVPANSVPQIKVDADGKIVIDKSSLFVEQSGVAKAKATIAKRGIILEKNIPKRYNRKKCRGKQWSPQDTLKFYLLLNTVGTDFTLIASAFPDRSRNCIKSKYKKEETLRPYLIDKALETKGTFDIEGMKKSLELFAGKIEDAKKEKIAKFKKLKQLRIDQISEEVDESGNFEKIMHLKRKPERKRKGPFEKMLFNDDVTDV